MSGKHIELFLVDGEPGGITTAEIAGWSGHVLAGPRSDLANLIKRPEAQRNGTYLLLGHDEEALDGMQCYIGKTENFAHRFRDHDAKKDFWDRAIIISSKDDSYNEGHWGYLESRLVELAKDARRSDLPNIQNPQTRKLSEAQASDMEAFIHEIKVILPVLGVNVLRGRKAAVTPHLATPEDSPVFTLHQTKNNIRARAQLIDGEFTVLEGSTCVSNWNTIGKSASTKRSYAAYREQHAKLTADGTINIEEHQGTFTRDVAFPSPSTAGAIILGRSCNGRTSWIYNGQTFGDWENRDI